MNKVLIFTGAGVCVPLGLPITTGFSEIIRKCPSTLLSFLNNYLKGDSEDIEKIVSTLEIFLNDDTFLDFIIHVHNDGHFRHVQEKLSNMRGTARSFLVDMKSGLYDLLDTFSQDKAKTLYLSIISELQSCYKDPRVSIFTTNYDLTFESTAYHFCQDFQNLGIKDIVFCFKPEFGTFAFDKDEKFEWNSEKIEYIKLHGSLDWQADDLVICTKSGTATKPADPNKAPLLYPGFKGIPNADPFSSFHERLVQRLNEASVVYIVGFAFRDPYINKIFEFFLKSRSKVHVYCYNPLPLKDLPSESAIPQFCDEFKNFQYIQRGIEISETPLALKENKAIKPARSTGA